MKHSEMKKLLSPRKKGRGKRRTIVVKAMRAWNSKNPYVGCGK